MKHLEIAAIKSRFCILLLSTLLVSVSVASAQDKVVVVPLFDDAATGPITRVISIPAASMSYNSSSGIISDHALGLLWQFNYSTSANILVKAPDDYAGGDVNFHILFSTTTATRAAVNFFLRPTSYDSGEGRFDPGSVSGSIVFVSGSIGFGTVYQQSFTIPASRMTKSWWYTTIQRQGTGATYSDDVVVLGAAFDYQASN